MDSKDFNPIFPMGDKDEELAQFFTGRNYINMLSATGVVIRNVTFEPGCRSYWHIHHKGGEILLCTAGRGYFQEFGKPVQELHPGDVVHIQPELKHWHGATPNSWFSHLNVEIPAAGAFTESLEPVSGEEYN